MYCYGPSEKQHSVITYVIVVINSQTVLTESFSLMNKTVCHVPYNKKHCMVVCPENFSIEENILTVTKHSHRRLLT